MNAFDKGKASIEKLDIAGPGFINFYMNNQYLTKLIPAVLEAKKNMAKRIQAAVKKFRLSSYRQTQQGIYTLDMPAAQL